MDEGLHSSPAGSSQGSDSGLAMMSPMEADFSSSVFSQLTSDLQQMLGVGETKGKCVCMRGGGRERQREREGGRKRGRRRKVVGERERSFEIVACVTFSISHLAGAQLVLSYFSHFLTICEN